VVRSAVELEVRNLSVHDTIGVGLVMAHETEERQKKMSSQALRNRLADVVSVEVMGRAHTGCGSRQVGGRLSWLVLLGVRFQSSSSPGCYERRTSPGIVLKVAENQVPSGGNGLQERKGS
jgi:hypothetical protein